MSERGTVRTSDDERHRDAPQEFDEVTQRPRAVADGIEWGEHPILPLVPS